MNKQNFHNQLINHFMKNVFIQPRFSKNEIIIKHYAGDVTYDTIGFLEKTKKSFGIQMKRMMKNSQQKDYAKLFVEDENEQKSGIIEIPKDQLLNLGMHYPN